MSRKFATTTPRRRVGGLLGLAEPRRCIGTRCLPQATSLVVLRVAELTNFTGLRLRFRHLLENIDSQFPLRLPFYSESGLTRDIQP